VTDEGAGDRDRIWDVMWLRHRFSEPAATHHLRAGLGVSVTLLKVSTVTRLFASVACAAKQQPHFGVEVTSVRGVFPVPGGIETGAAAYSLPKRACGTPDGAAIHSDRAPGQGCPPVGDMKGAMTTTGHLLCPCPHRRHGPGRVERVLDESHEQGRRNHSAWGD
jgi:hypothetical protein